MKKVTLMTAALLFISSAALAETLTLTTYYPAPFGAYDQIRLVPRATLFGACDVGTLYVNQAGQIQYCRDEGGVGIWGFLSGLWTQSGNNVYLSNSSSAVGIGTDSPGTKLHIVDNNTSNTDIKLGSNINAFGSPGFSADNGIAVNSTGNVGLFLNGNGPTGIALYKNGTSGAVVAYDDKLSLRTYNGEPIYFQPGSPTPHMIVFANGKVAIGTDNADESRKLEVNGRAYVTQHLSVGGFTNTNFALNVSGDTWLDGKVAIGTNTSDPNIRLSVNRDAYIGRNLGIGKFPQHPIHHASGAKLTAGGQWIDASSRENKKDIEPLTLAKASETLKGLDPVEFKYKAEDDDTYIGFIAEDVPDLVATKDRDGLSPMDIVAVLTKVVQNQQSLLEEQQKVLEQQNKEIEQLKSRIGHLQ